jgi:hypothetical protein
MSFQAMTWAVEQELPAMQKIVLLMLANRTNHDTGLCFPSHDRLTKECGMSKSSVIRQIESLEKGGLLKVTRSTNKPNSYILNLGSVRETPSVRVTPLGVSERHPDSVRVTPEPVINHITITTTNDDENFLTFDGLKPDEIECYNWAKTHNYWNFSTESVHKFLTLYTKNKRDGLKAQFDAHKKALQDGLGQTGQSITSTNKTIGTGGNYATHYTNSKPLNATQLRNNLSKLIAQSQQRQHADIFSTATQL